MNRITNLPGRMRAYLKQEEIRCKSSTIAGYQVNLRHFRDYLHEAGLTPTKPGLARLTQGHLRDYLQFLNRRNLVPYTKVNYLLSVKKYLQWEVDHGTLKEHLLEGLDRKHLPKVPEYLPRPLSQETDRLLTTRLRESPNPYAPLFLLLRQTGLRISELINLPRDCVITSARGEEYLKVPLGKMDNERLVPLASESLSLIGKIRDSFPLRSDRCDQNRLIGIRGDVRQIYPCLNLHFRKLTGSLIDQNKPITFHRLRHTYATTLLTGGVGLPSLMKLLGHRRIEMTLRYAEVSPSHMRNEYLKAIKILENQSALVEIQTHAATSDHCHPAHIIRQLASFLTKAAPIGHARQKNLLRRLRRLQHDLALIDFSQEFKLRGNRGGG